MDIKEEDYELQDVEDYRGQKDLVFSHQGLVMKAMNRIIELCGHELTEGTNETYIDPIKRTTKIVYKEDTKKAFVTAVQVCKTIMNCDFDKEARENLEDLFEIIDDKKKELLGKQWAWWSSLSVKQQKEAKLGMITETFLHRNSIWYMEFIEFEIEAYLEIFEELNNLTKRLHFYKEEEFEG